MYIVMLACAMAYVSMTVYIVMLICAMAHTTMTMYIKYFYLLFTARYTHQTCVCAVPPEEKQVMSETCRGFEF
jgi:hypothetical protein